MVSRLTYHGEPVEAYGKMNGVKSLYTGSVLQGGVRHFCYVIVI